MLPKCGIGIFFFICAVVQVSHATPQEERQKLFLRFEAAKTTVRPCDSLHDNVCLRDAKLIKEIKKNVVEGLAPQLLSLLENVDPVYLELVKAAKTYKTLSKDQRDFCLRKHNVKFYTEDRLDLEAAGKHLGELAAMGKRFSEKNHFVISCGDGTCTVVETRKRDAYHTRQDVFVNVTNPYAKAFAAGFLKTVGISDFDDYVIRYQDEFGPWSIAPWDVVPNVNENELEQIANSTSLEDAIGLFQRSKTFIAYFDVLTLLHLVKHKPDRFDELDSLLTSLVDRLKNKIDEREFSSESKILLKEHFNYLTVHTEVPKHWQNVSALEYLLAMYREAVEKIDKSHFCAFDNIHSEIALTTQRLYLKAPYSPNGLGLYRSLFREEEDLYFPTLHTIRLSSDHFYLFNFDSSIGFKYGSVVWVLARHLIGSIDFLINKNYYWQKDFAGFRNSSLFVEMFTCYEEYYREAFAAQNKTWTPKDTVSGIASVEGARLTFELLQEKISGLPEEKQKKEKEMFFMAVGQYNCFIDESFPDLFQKTVDPFVRQIQAFTDFYECHPEDANYVVSAKRCSFFV